MRRLLLQDMPAEEWLQQLWLFIRQLLCGGAVSPERLQADLTSLHALGGWPLIPLANGQLGYVSERFMVFTPPISLPEAAPEQPQQTEQTVTEPHEESAGPVIVEPPAAEAVPVASGAGHDLQRSAQSGLHPTYLSFPHTTSSLPLHKSCIRSEHKGQVPLSTGICLCSTQWCHLMWPCTSRC